MDSKPYTESMAALKNPLDVDRINIDDPAERQAFYEALIAAHQGLTDGQSELLNARLVLLLANHVGDLAVLREAIALARKGVVPDQAASATTS